MHIHDDTELIMMTTKLLKAQDDDLAEELRNVGYGSPKYLANKINEAVRWHQRYLDGAIERIGQRIREILEDKDLIEMPEGYRPLSIDERGILKADKPHGWANYVWNVLQQNGITETILEEHLDLKDFIEEKIITSTVMDTASHVWEAYAKKPRSTQQVTQFFKRIYSDNFKSQVSRHASQISAKMALTDAKGLERAFKKGIIEGNGVYDVIANLRDHHDFNSARSRAFAITEVLTSYAEGTQIGFEQSEVVEEKEWVHTGAHKNDPRPHHQALDGTRIPKDEYFSVAGHKALYPRDRDLPVGERVNCHCGIDPVIDLNEFGITEEDLEQMRAEAKDEIENQYSIEELEEMLVETHQQVNPSPLDIGDIQFTPSNVSDLTEDRGSGIIEVETEGRSVGVLFAGVTRIGEPFRYDPDTTQVALDTDKSYNDYIEIRGINKWDIQDKHNKYSEIVNEERDIQDKYNKYFEIVNEEWESKPRDYPVHEAIGAIRMYSSAKYWDINRYLRGTKSELTPELQETVDILMSEIEQSELVDNMVLYRGIGRDALRDKPIKVGAMITDPAFVSTSTMASTAIDFADDNQGYLLKITSPKGTKALSIDKYSAHRGELEVLMQAGTSFRIDKIHERKSGLMVLEVTSIQSWRE